MTARIIPLRKPRKPDPHGEMLSAAERLDPHWTPERIAQMEYACRRIEDELHIECAGDPDFNNRLKETW